MLSTVALQVIAEERCARELSRSPASSLCASGGRTANRPLLRCGEQRRTCARLRQKAEPVSGFGVRRRTATIWPPAVAAARFIALTGWRLGEVVGLRWPELDLARRTATLADSKTGRSVRPLSKAACDVLCALPRLAGDRVFPPTRGGVDTVLNFKKFWPRIAKLGELPS